MKHKRAPYGFRIVRWSDGFYHVYSSGVCLLETLKKQDAIDFAWREADRQDESAWDHLLKEESK